MLRYINNISLGKSIKVINTQAQFDALVISDNDRIKLNNNVVFYGGVFHNKNNVEITGGCISGGVPINNLTWTYEGDNIYSALLPSDPKWINIDGKSAKLAERPWKKISGTVGSTQVTINPSDVSEFTNIIGSYIVFRENEWAYSERYKVQNYNGVGTITLDRARHSAINGGDDYKLFNDEEYFLGNNEWIWRNGKVKIKSTSSPSSLYVTQSIHDYAIKTTGNNSSILGVELKEHYLYGINSFGNNTIIDSCEIHNTRGQGIKIATRVSNPIIQNASIHDVGHNGIWCGPIDGVNIKNCDIVNVGVGENIGWNNESFGSSSQTDGTGIKFNVDINSLTDDANNVIIENNYIDNCAYNGVSLHIGQTGSIKRNVVSNTNQVLFDGGGIYCFHYRPTNLPFSDFIIKENFITMDSPGNGRGVYMDNRCAGNEISHNVVDVINGDAGIYISADTKTNNVHHNTVRVSSDRGLWYRDWAAPNKIYVNDENLINHNIIIAKNSSTYPMQFSESVNPYANGGSGDNNVFISPYGTTVLNDGINKTLAQLQSTYSQDANSVELTNYITAPGDPDNEVLLITNPSDGVLEGTAPSGNWYDVGGVLTTSYSVPAWGSLVLLKDLI